MADDAVVQKLASLLFETGENIAKGLSCLSLTGRTLKIVNDAVTKQERSGETQPYSTVFARNVSFLKDFFSGVPAVKISGLPNHLDNFVDLSAFKSLHSLSIKRVPVSLVLGLSGLREQCKRLSCQRCVTDIKDLLLTCGGDQSGPLSWSVLIDLDLSYNNISKLNDSMKLCLSVQRLDLSHNQIVHDEDSLQYLHHLCTLNLGFNRLELLPKLNQRACLCLTRLVLRNNNLSVIAGIECLKHLEHVDLSYNCLISHSDLAPLQQLNQLTKLFLNNNPLAFHPYHRSLTAGHLSSHINPEAISLDGKRLTDLEKHYLPKPDRYGVPSPATDSLYLTAGGSSLTVPRDAGKSPQKLTPLSKNKGKEREASIHEEDFTRFENGEQSRVRTKLVFDDNDSAANRKREQVEMLRKEVGDEWLVSYQERNKKPEEDAANASGSAVSISKVGSDINRCEEFQKQPKPSSVFDKDDDEQDGVNDGVCQEVFTVWLEDSDDENLDEETSCFVCVTDRFVVEKDNSAKEIDRLDRNCLQKAVFEPGSIEDGDTTRNRPMVRLEFDHTRRDRRKRHYFLETKEQCEKLISILQASINANTAVQLIWPKYECLKCSTGFKHSSHNNSDSSVLPHCPRCNSDHVVGRGLGGGGSSVTQQPSISRQSTPVPFIELIRESTPVMFDSQSIASVGEISKPSRYDSHAANMVLGEQPAAIITTELVEDLDKSCSSSFIDNVDEIKSTDSSNSSPAMQKHNMLPTKHHRSLSQPWNGLVVNKGILRCKSEDDVGLHCTPDSVNEETIAASSWSNSIRVAYERESSRTGFRSHSTSRTASLDSLLGGSSPNTSRKFSSSVKTTTTSAVSETANSSRNGLSSLWMEIDSNNCTDIHHRLKLYYDLQLLTEDSEQFDSHFKCDVVLCNKADEQSGLVILSNRRCFLCTCSELPHSFEDWSWIRVNGRYSFDSLRIVTVGLGKQSIRLEFKSSSSVYVLLFKDAMRSSIFINRLAACARADIPMAEVCPLTQYNLRTLTLGWGDLESLKAMACDIRSVLLDSTDLIQDKRQHGIVYRQSTAGSDLVSWLCSRNVAPDKPKACALVQQLVDIKALCHHVIHQDEDADSAGLFSFSAELGGKDDPFELFVLCHRIIDEECQGTVAFMVTTTDVYLLQQNFHQPEPNMTDDLLQQFSAPQFITTAEEQISNISELIVYKSHPLRLSFGFFESEESRVWDLQLETVITMEILISTVSRLWQREFEVPLEVTELP
ncbi:serine/threonine-protein kinase 11-interacting protein-like [Corticium candelabrum]|uniref:serine/threonine-protein kinase 11-interacting protein-like n=1 Tax=Corticium candelabrum TaxID=121492 RepID=UPI002E276F01|nr:serine/threonine-protein kinase 11-interacting protein-like [Corticium candelabrum]